MNKPLGAILIFLTVLIWTLNGIYGVKSNYEYNRKYESYWSLADKSSSIPKKSELVDKFVTALEKSDLHGKYDAVFLETPDNSFDENLTALKTLQTRLHEIKTMDVTSFQYQSAIQQITAQEQGEAHNMLSVFSGVWEKENYPLLWGWIFMINLSVSCILLVAGLGFVGFWKAFFLS